MAERRCVIEALFILVVLTTNLFGFISAFSVTVTVEGGCGSTHFIGNELIFSVNLSEGAYVTIWVVTPDDEQNITEDTYKRKGITSFSGTVLGPEGTHTLHVEARNRYGKTAMKSLEDHCTIHTGFYPEGYRNYLSYCFLVFTDQREPVKSVFSLFPATSFIIELDKQLLIFAHVISSQVERRLICLLYDMKTTQMIKGYKQSWL